MLLNVKYFVILIKKLISKQKLKIPKLEIFEFFFGN